MESHRSGPNDDENPGEPLQYSSRTSVQSGGKGLGGRPGVTGDGFMPTGPQALCCRGRLLKRPLRTNSRIPVFLKKKTFYKNFANLIIKKLINIIPLSNICVVLVF